MNVGQLQRLLRTLPKGMAVLLEGIAGPYVSDSSDFRIQDFRGRWGPKAVVVTPLASTPGREPRRRPKQRLRPIERLRTRQQQRHS